MTIDVENMLVNIGEHLQKVNWLDAGVTFVSVFLGALFAYRFGLKLEIRKAKRQMRGDFCTLSTQLHLNLEDMLDYKKNILDKIKADYENNKSEAISTIIRGPMVSFAFNMDKYIFLNDCNRCFIPEIKIVQSSYDTLCFVWANYNERLISTRQLYAHGDKNIFDNMRKLFLFNYNHYNQVCIRLYYLEKHFNECYRRYFNTYYYDDNEDELEANAKIEQYIPGALQDEEFVKIAEFFDKYWAPDYTLWESIKYHYRKIKYHLKGLKIYFFGRGKPKTKCKSKGKK